MSSKSEPLKIADIEWRNGQPYSRRFGDVYFSDVDGLEEAKHVFIAGNGLIERWKGRAQDFVIAETGFGSGLNFLLAWSLWKQHAKPMARLHYISVEHEPLSREDLIRCLDLWPSLAPLAQELIEHYPVLTPGIHRMEFDAGRVHLSLMLDDVLHAYQELLVCGDIDLEPKLRHFFVDAWFLDGFAPAKNPQMWTDTLFTVMNRLSQKGTTLATFSVASAVKKALNQAGFSVCKKAGFGKKREMLSAHFLEAAPQRIRRCTPWHIAPLKNTYEKKALVVGGGLAGCYTAHALAKRGWKVILLEEKKHIASSASGNSQAVLYPKFSAFHAPFTDFMLMAYLYAVHAYRNILSTVQCGALNGMLQLPHRERERLNQEHLCDWLSYYPELGALMDKKFLSEEAGVSLSSEGLWVVDSGWMDIPALCAYLVKHPNIQINTNARVDSLEEKDGIWRVGGETAAFVILANGQKANNFRQTSHLPLKAMRGQVTFMAENEESKKLRIPLCASGHILPARQGMHSIGATYHGRSLDETPFSEDDILNLNKLDDFASHISWSRKIVGHWVGIRAATPDYLPLVGPAADEVFFKQEFASLASNPHRWLPKVGTYYPGLYLCAGFGSRGLTMIPLCAEWLAASLNQEPGDLSRSMVQAIAPARFLRRSCYKSC